MTAARVAAGECVLAAAVDLSCTVIHASSDTPAQSSGHRIEPGCCSPHPVPIAAQNDEQNGNLSPWA